MARSPLTYAGALALLGQHEHRLLNTIDKLLGGAILASTPFTGPAVWALIEPKNEAIEVTRALLDKVKSRALGTSGHTRHELLAAAHTVLVISSFFDALAAVIGPAYQQLRITDQDKLSLADPGEAADQIFDLVVPMPCAGRDFTANLGELSLFFARLTSATMAFIMGLADGEQLLRPIAGTSLVSLASERYADAYFRFAVDVPEFAIWVAWNDTAELRRSQNQVLDVLDRQSSALSRLFDLLSLTAPDRPVTGHRYRELLANKAQSVLTKSLLRTDSEQPPGNLAFPTVEHGFVTPHFKTARYTKDAQPTQEVWWGQGTRQSDLDELLAAHLTSDDSSRLPLLILGHPGAGKSLLTEVIAARLPASAFTVVRVPLRSVVPTKPLHEQIAGAMEVTLQQKADWGELTRECESTVRVVILDGFDELLLATGVTQTAYLEDVRRFQETELDLGRPVAVIVTSRTLVADRARIPLGCLMIKLEEFDNDQITTWLDAWNSANAGIYGFRPLESDELLSHDRLARQPLILLILAIYAAESGRRLDSEDLSGARLYQRLLDSFIARQVRDKSDRPLSDTEAAQLEQYKRWQLSMAAFGMFNRGSQHIDATELEADLTAFHQPGQRDRVTFDRHIGPAEQTISDFFFVQVSRAESDARRTYEFLHATFGEYLIAEHTMALLGQLASTARFPGAEPPNDDRLFALLAHQSILKQRPIVEFAREIHASRESVLEIITELLWRARSHARPRNYDRYEPTPYDTVCRLANYTANLTVLRALLAEGNIPLRNLAPAGTDPLPWWRSLVHLWESGLDAEAWSHIKYQFTLSYGSEPALLTNAVPGDHERLLLHNSREMQIQAGQLLFLSDLVIETEDERALYDNVITANLPFGSTFPLTRLMPRSEEGFESIIAAIKSGNRLSGRSPQSLWRALSHAAPYLPFGIVDELISILLAGHESRHGERWTALGSEFATVVAAHPQLLRANEEVAAVLKDSDFPKTNEDAPLAAVALWKAEQTSSEPETSALNALRAKFDERAAEDPSCLSSIWMVPDYLTYLRTIRPACWKLDYRALSALRAAPALLRRTAPEDALYVVTECRSDPARNDGQELAFVSSYLKAHEQPVNTLTGYNAVERLREYARQPWTRP